MSFSGPKYDSTLDTVAIAKLIRKDLEQAFKNGLLPEGLKVEIRTERFSAGDSIDASIREVPPNTPVRNPGWPVNKDRFSPLVQAWLDIIGALVLAYHSDAADRVGDHPLPNFYYRTTVSSKL